VKLERRVATCAVLFALGVAAGTAYLTWYPNTRSLAALGSGLEIGSLVAWWAPGRDETEWVSVRRWRSLATVAMAGGTGLIASRVVLLGLGPWGFAAGRFAIAIGRPYLGGGLALGGARRYLYLRTAVDRYPGGF
jgi:hypothetical protein